MIPFNRPCILGNEIDSLKAATSEGFLSGDGDFTRKCQTWFNSELTTSRTFMTTSCSMALDMAAILSEISPGDEVIMPSYTFVSTANSFVAQGAIIKFVDIRPDTMNLDEKLIERAITSKTKVIVPVHYAGVACEMNTIIDVAKANDIFVIEDAAQGMMAKYRGQSLGTFGELGSYSFHATKNYTSGGEGGLLIVNNLDLVERSEVIREKGTNRSKFFRGQVDKYTWVDRGSSYLPSELNAAFLLPQLQVAKKILDRRLQIWNWYNDAFKNYEGEIGLPFIPADCEHNGHMFYLKMKDLNHRTQFINQLKKQGVSAVFHYVPLHSSPAGRKYGSFVGDDCYTTKESERIVRLPIYYNMCDEDVFRVIEVVNNFFKS